MSIPPSPVPTDSTSRRLRIGERLVGDGAPPLVVPEIGINHEGSVEKALRMVDDAAKAGAELVKFQCHVIEDEMIPAAKDVVPGNAEEGIWEIMERCALSEEETREVKAYVEDKGLMYLSTPFSRAAADRLEALGVDAYKIGSGECNNTPLIDHVASFGKPVILSTGMNDISTVAPSVEILERRGVDYALLHCTSMYPTPYDKVRLGGITELGDAFPNAVLGLSDHSLGNWTCFGAVPYGARILEKHFTSDTRWPGPDVPISIDPRELEELIVGSKAIFEALGGGKTILAEEQPTIDFAYACVVSTRDIQPGETLNDANTWVKRPGTGEIHAKDYANVLGKTARTTIPQDTQIAWAQLA
ncbi:MAG: N-acetylneuraminate synthase family protein [Myxococcota bacterium]